MTVTVTLSTICDKCGRTETEIKPYASSRIPPCEWADLKALRRNKGSENWASSKYVVQATLCPDCQDALTLWLEGLEEAFEDTMHFLGMDKVT